MNEKENEKERLRIQKVVKEYRTIIASLEKLNKLFPPHSWDDKIVEFQEYINNCLVEN
jgi:hypothetical protein